MFSILLEILSIAFLILIVAAGITMLVDWLFNWYDSQGSTDVQAQQAIEQSDSGSTLRSARLDETV